jgi:hypothetical protein
MASSHSEAAKVLVVCRTFLAGIKARSPAQMRSVILPGEHGTLIRPTPEGKEILQLTIDGVINRIPFDRPEIELETIAGTEWEDDVGMFLRLGLEFGVVLMEDRSRYVWREEEQD